MHISEFYKLVCDLANCDEKLENCDVKLEDKDRAIILLTSGKPTNIHLLNTLLYGRTRFRWSR